MANTVIQLKWSEVTSTPVTLNVAEPAYSNTSGKLFIGRTNGGPIAVGGSYYTALIDAATNSNTASAIVKRDANGAFSGRLYGTANDALQWTTARTIGVSGDATGTVSVDGSANANIPLTLSNSGVTAGTYGSASQVPSITVDAKGRVTSASNVAISIPTTLNIANSTVSGSLSLATDTLTLKGGSGITSTVYDANNTFVLDVDNTVIRTTGNQTITGDFSVSGNLTITGNTTLVNVSTLQVNDPLIYLGENNYSSDLVDIGFAGNYYDGATQRHAGIFRKHGSNTFYAFTQYTPEPNTTNVIDTTDPSFMVGTLVANITSANVSGLLNPIAVADGGTGAATFSSGRLIVGNGTGALQSLANTGTAGTYGNAAYVPVVTTDAYGRVSGVTNTAIAVDTSAITSGTLPIARGGTNQTSYTTGAMLQFNGTSITSLANTGTAGTYGSASYHPIITTDAYGRVSSVSNTAIAIDASAITSGTLGVARGGTGNTSLINGTILIGAGTGAITTLANTGTAGTYGNATVIPVVTTDAYGRVSSVTNTAISFSDAMAYAAIMS